MRLDSSTCNLAAQAVSLPQASRFTICREQISHSPETMTRKRRRMPCWKGKSCLERSMKRCRTTGARILQSPTSSPSQSLKNNRPFLQFLRPTLNSALRQLRDEHTERYLWVDALCLNQSDDEDGHKEKSIQIPRIDLIYNKAKVSASGWVLQTRLVTLLWTL